MWPPFIEAAISARIEEWIGLLEKNYSQRISCEAIRYRRGSRSVDFVHGKGLLAWTVTFPGYWKRLLEFLSGFRFGFSRSIMIYGRAQRCLSFFLSLSLFLPSLFLSLSLPSKSNFLLKCTWNDVGPFQGIVMSKYRNCSRDSSDFLFRGCQLLEKGLVLKI